MVLNHVANHARVIVVSASELDAKLFSNRDLNVLDIASVPYGLENGIPKAEYHNVLNRLFAKVMIDPVNLRFLDVLADFLVQRSGTHEVLAEGLFYDDAFPAVRGFRAKAHGAELLDDRGEKPWRYSKVKQNVSRQVPSLLRVGNLRGKVFECVYRLEVALNIVAALCKILPFLVVHGPGRELLNIFSNSVAIHLVIAIGRSNSDDSEIGWQELKGLKIIKGWQEFSFGQITGGTEDNYGARIAGTFVAGERLFGHCERN